MAIQQDVLAGIFATDSSGSRLAGQSAEEIVQHHGEMRRELYADLYRTLCLDELLNFLEPD